MNDVEYDRNIKKLGSLRERLRRLEEDDYVTASYKGYSSDGLTLNEILEAIQSVNKSIELAENKLADEPKQY